MTINSYSNPVFEEVCLGVKRPADPLRSRPSNSSPVASLRTRSQAASSRKPSSPIPSGERPGSSDSAKAAGKMIMDASATSAAPKSLARKPARNSSTPAATRHNDKPVAARNSAGGVAKSPSAVLAAAKRPASLQAETCEAEEQKVEAPEPVVHINRDEEEGRRKQIVAALCAMPNFDPASDPRAFHGRCFCLQDAAAPVPACVWKSDKKPRESSPDWLTASEYKEDPKVFRAKIQLLASLLMASRRTLAYTGAGLSVAAGIGMAAVGSKGGAGTGMGVATAGEPTLAHCVLAELNRQSLLHGWVQQNHDGLPQKAGYRQEEINEIHGSWFDPSNPVVKYSGSLRGDLFEDMEHQAESVDLVLVLGTSLTGLNADQCVTKTAIRSSNGSALGSVIISPQKTAQDGKCALRIFAKADEVMEALAKEFGFGPRAVGRSRGVRCSADLFSKEDRVLVPYDKDGRRSATVKTYWDLSKGQKVRISGFNNLRGAHQPNDKGIDEKTQGTVTGRDPRACAFIISIGGTNKKLGLWWLETAMRGGLEYLPVVNVDAKEIRA